MTVCIAALSENRKKCHMISDCMVTANTGGFTYESETSSIQKIKKVEEDFYVLSAGDALSGSSILTEYEETTKNKNKISTDNTSNKDRLNILQIIYHSFKNKKFADLYLNPRGIDDLSHYTNIQSRLNPQVVQFIESQLSIFNIDVEFLISCKDKDGICHIYTLNQTLVCHDAVGYACIGSGSPHSFYSIIGSNYSVDLKESEVIKILKEAKKNSEVAVGVGLKTQTKDL